MVIPSKKEVRSKVDASLDLLLKYDSYLLENDVNERSISHKLAVYLEEKFRDWNVDCEYNRHYDEVKRLDMSDCRAEAPTLKDTEAKTVFPDIIIHRRSTDDNLLVIEIKKTTSSVSDDFDLCKLRAFKSELNYHYALFIRFLTGDKGIGINRCEWI